MSLAVERYLSNLPYIAALRGAPWGFGVGRVPSVCPDIGTAYQDIWEPGGSLQYLLAASKLEIASSDAADALLGAGATQVRVTGLDADYKRQDEVLALDGLTPVLTTKDYLRVNGLEIVAAGVDGVAIGDLTLRVQGAGAVQAFIAAGVSNRSLASHYTVPAATTLYIVETEYSSDSQSTRFILVTRKPGEPFRAQHVFQTGVEPTEPKLTIPVEVTEKTDIKMVAKRTTSASAIGLCSYSYVFAPKTLSAIRSLGNPTV